MASAIGVNSGEQFRARERKREREGVGEVPHPTEKLRGGDVVEESERNGGELRTQRRRRLWELGLARAKAAAAGLARSRGRRGGAFIGAKDTWACGPGKARRSRRRVGLFPELESGSGGRWKADLTGGARASERERVRGRAGRAGPGEEKWADIALWAAKRRSRPAAEKKKKEKKNWAAGWAEKKEGRRKGFPFSKLIQTLSN